MALSFGRIRTRLGVNHFGIFQIFWLIFGFFPRKFAAFSNQGSYLWSQQRDQGAG